jgi:hypothetical protein
MYNEENLSCSVSITSIAAIPNPIIIEITIVFSSMVKLLSHLRGLSNIKIELSLLYFYIIHIPSFILITIAIYGTEYKPDSYFISCIA